MDCSLRNKAVPSGFPSTHHSKLLPCCRQPIHEACLVIAYNRGSADTGFALPSLRRPACSGTIIYLPDQNTGLVYNIFFQSVAPTMAPLRAYWDEVAELRHLGIELEGPHFS